MNFLTTGPEDATARVLLAHGAGAPMDTPFMNAFAKALAEHELRTFRFELAYMASRRIGEGRKPPPKAERVMGEFLAAVDDTPAGGPLFIGGKSMGGRVASMVAEELFRAKKIAGLFCLGYPFHPPGRPEKLRTAHLKDLTVPALICQGTRDPFGTREDVASYSLSPAIRIHWLESGDHDFRPEKGSETTAKESLRSAADAVAAWIRRGEGA
jgi:predicted alpha/beta-hydrolase family hydrolase